MSAGARAGDSRQLVLNRLKRAHGQVGAVIRAVESGAPCKDVATQLAAVVSALKRAAFLVIASGLRQRLHAADVDADDGETPEDLEKLFFMLA